MYLWNTHTHTHTHTHTYTHNIYFHNLIWHFLFRFHCSYCLWMTTICCKYWFITYKKTESKGLYVSECEWFEKRHSEERRIRQMLYLSRCSIWTAARLSTADTDKLPEENWGCWRQKSDLNVTEKQRNKHLFIAFSHMTGSKTWRAKHP